MTTEAVLDAAVREGAQGGGTLVDVLTATAERFPEHVALEAAGGRMTYRELYDWCVARADRLRAAGIGPGDRVGVRVESGTADLYLSILAVLFAGATYVPVDVDDPDERAERVFRLAGVKAVLTPQLVPVAGGSTPSVTRAPASDDDAWVIFTSGSTGEPKGVAVSHRSATAWVRAESRLWTVCPEDRVLAGLSVAFDASCEEMWLAWAHGAALVAAPRRVVRSGDEFAEWLVASGVTVVSTVPSLAQFFDDELVGRLRLLILGGEALPSQLAERLGDRVETWNTYGPTEATVVSTAARVRAGAPVTMGHGLDGWLTAVVDAEGFPVATGEPGELAIAGVGLGRYIDPSLDAQRFAPLPVFGYQRAYRTGDMVRETPDGYAFIGRKDDQVKIGGRRVELGEVDALLASAPGVRQAAATVRRTEAGGTILVGYVTGDVDPSAVGDHVAAGLSGGLRPLVVTVDAMPLRTSGKVDRDSLPWPPRDAGAHQALSAAQRVAADAWTKELGPLPLAPSSHFFELGGTSLGAARLVSELRGSCPSLTVSAIYEHPTLAGFADRLTFLGMHGTGSHEPVTDEADDPVLASRARRSSVVMLVVVAVILALTAIPWLVDLLVYNDLFGDATVPKASWLVLIPLWLVFGTAFGRATFAFLSRRLLLPRVEPGRYSRFSSVAIRLWIVDRLADVLHSDSFAGTPWAGRCARLAGFDVHPTAGLSTLPSPASFVTIGAGTTIEAEVELQGWYLDGTDLVIAPVRVEDGARVGQRASLAPGVTVGRGAEVAVGAVVTEDVPAAELWAGIPARCEGRAGQDWPTPGELPPARHALAWKLAFALGLLGETVLPLLAALPSLVVVALYGATAVASDSTLWNIVACSPLLAVTYAFTYSVLLALGVRLTGRLITPGWHPTYGRAAFGLWLTGNLMHQAIQGMFPLFATVYTPAWMRLAGMSVGRGSEFCTSGSVNKLVSLGSGSMVTDDVCFATARTNGRWMEVREITIGDRSFLGNGAILHGGTVIGDGCLVGVQTVSPDEVPDDTSWFGVPALEFPRQPTSADEARTHRPSTSLRIQRTAWETLRILLPYTVSILLAFGGYEAAVLVGQRWGVLVMALSIPLVFFISGLVATGITVLAKWLLIGRYPVADFPLWSSFVWRDEVINSLQEMLSGAWMLRAAMGTPVVSWYLRAMGARIGRHVSIDTLAITEYDQVRVDDYATVNREACLETHLFQDRVLQIGPTHVGKHASMGPRAAVLPFTSLGDGTHVGMRSVVMRGEQLPAGTSWLGSPVAPIGQTVPRGEARLLASRG